MCLWLLGQVQRECRNLDSLFTNILNALNLGRLLPSFPMRKNRVLKFQLKGRRPNEKKEL